MSDQDDEDHRRSYHRGWEENERPTWQDVMPTLVYGPLVFLALVLVSFPILKRSLRALTRSNHRLTRIIRRHVGSKQHPLPHRKVLWNVLSFLQIFSSFAVLGFFSLCSYLHHVPDVVVVLESICGWVLLLAFIAKGVRTEFKFRAIVLDPLCFITEVMTLPGLLMASVRSGQTSGSWISLHFLRLVPALSAYDFWCDLHIHGKMERGLNLSILMLVLKLVVLILCFAGTVFVCEVLGELPYIHDRLYTTSMGDISFFTTVYWAVETITTVGYGDMTPRTVLSRLVTIFFMLAGITFFTMELSQLVDGILKDRKGEGSFRKSKRHHIVVVGGGVLHPDLPILEAFFDEIYHPRYREHWPDVVIMTSKPESVEAIRRLVRQRCNPNTDGYITFLLGSAFLTADLQRCCCDSAQYVFIIADTTGKLDPWDEDKLNTMRALRLVESFKETDFRLMLMMPESRGQAEALGIRVDKCISVTEIRSGILWTSCQCIGASTLLENLLVTPHLHQADREVLTSSRPWMANYAEGIENMVVGFLPSQVWIKMLANDVVNAARLRNVAIIAAQHDGRLVLAPFAMDFFVSEATVFFALTRHGMDRLENLGSRWRQGVSWEVRFKANRREHDARYEAARKMDLLRRSGLLPFGPMPQPTFTGSRGLEAASPFVMGRTFSGHYNFHRQQSNSSEEQPDHPDHTAGAPSLCSILRKQGRQEAQRDPFVLEALQRKQAKDIIAAAKMRPFILLLELGGCAAGIVDFALRSRETFLPSKVPIIVLCRQLSSNLFDALGLGNDRYIAVLEGDPSWEHDLREAGVAECSVVACLSNTQHHFSESVDVPDVDVVILGHVLSKLHASHKQVIFEMHQCVHISMLPLPSFIDDLGKIKPPALQRRRSSGVWRDLRRHAIVGSAADAFLSAAAKADAKADGGGSSPLENGSPVENLGPAVEQPRRQWTPQLKLTPRPLPKPSYQQAAEDDAEDDRPQDDQQGDQPQRRRSLSPPPVPSESHELPLLSNFTASASVSSSGSVHPAAEPLLGEDQEEAPLKRVSTANISEGLKKMRKATRKLAQLTQLAKSVSTEAIEPSSASDDDCSSESEEEQVTPQGAVHDSHNLNHSLDPRFAVGMVFTLRTLGSLLARLSRVPGILELLQKLVVRPEANLPRLSFARYLWQVKIPRDEPGATLTYDLLHSDLMRGKHFDGQAAVPLGLLRSVPRYDDFVRGFVWTNPDNDTVVLETDWVYVLAGSEFGKVAHQRGLLSLSSRVDGVGAEDLLGAEAPPAPGTA